MNRLDLNPNLLWLAVSLSFSSPLHAQGVELSGLVDVRAMQTDGARSWTDGGLGKTRYDGSGVRLGQAILGAELPLNDLVSASAVINGGDRRHIVDLQEAWLSWNPLPAGPWKVRARAGLFFPRMNREIDYDQLTWTPTRTISASAINSWIGEEFRTKGLEFSLTHLGRSTGSPHDIGVTVAAFDGNDPAGTLLAWRGWGIGDRITGVSESILLADLPVYRPDGAINKQTREIKLFREIDGRLGYYAAVNYGYAGQLDLSAMHYDNRGDPLVVRQGQYSWATKFNHLGMRLHTSANWEVLAQWMSGSTAMGAQAVALDYRAWYALASRRVTHGALTLRYDQFSTREHDLLPADPNGEAGRSVAIAYVHELTPALSLVTELLCVRSTRPSRRILGESPEENARSITTALRWKF